jgi:PTH1 family peptidyl-tRNA hydrolase
MKVIIGLGNPGKEYDGTRHSVGMFYLKQIAKNWDEKLEDRGGLAEITSYGSGKKKAWLIFPAEFMNNSGATLKKIFSELKLKLKPEDILVIHDDLDIEVGRTKLIPAKSGAGHNGVISVEKALRTKKFWRLRIGIEPKRKTSRLRSKQAKKDPKDFLLSKFSPAEQKLITKNSKKIKEGAILWLENPARAMNLINQR